MFSFLVDFVVLGCVSGRLRWLVVALSGCFWVVSVLVLFPAVGFVFGSVSWLGRLVLT